MNKVVISFLILIFLSNYGYGQEEVVKIIRGKIVATATDLEGIYVVNLKTEEAVITLSSGYFTIPVTEGDTLMFSSIQYKGKRVVLSKSDLEKELLLVPLELIVNQLKEVRVMYYKNINAVALGIISSRQKSYTPAEKKLKTARSLGIASNSNGMSGGSFSVDPLLNMFSGRTAMLKKELDVERKEFWLEEINTLFDEKNFVETFKIPIDYVKGFKYYIVENKRFLETLRLKNKSMSSFLLGELAVKYNEMIACDQE